MHDNGTAKPADDRISTPGIIQAVRGNSDLPARAWGAASTSLVLFVIEYLPRICVSLHLPLRMKPPPLHRRASTGHRATLLTHFTAVDWWGRRLSALEKTMAPRFCFYCHTRRIFARSPCGTRLKKKCMQTCTVFSLTELSECEDLESTAV